MTDKPSRRGRKLRKALLLPLVGLLLAGGAFEIVLRVLDPLQYGDAEDQQAFMREIVLPEAPAGRPQLSARYLRPGARSSLFGAAVEINELGYRGPLYEKTKPPGVYRIVVVGDSVPFGWGIEESECFPRVLERRLNELERPFERERVEVLNLSAPGRGLGDYILMLQEHGLGFDPDLVIVPFVCNDVPLENVVPADAFAEPWQLPAALRSVWTLRFGMSLLNSIRDTQQAAEYWIGVKTNDKANQACCIGFQLLKQTCGDVPLLILDTVGDRPGEGIEAIASFTADRGIDRLEAYLDIDEVDRWGVRPPLDPHPNAQAHAHYAELILGWLRTSGKLR